MTESVNVKGLGNYRGFIVTDSKRERNLGHYRSSIVTQPQS
jgi:hypothetical protein